MQLYCAVPPQLPSGDGSPGAGEAGLAASQLPDLGWLLGLLVRARSQL
jgi:hypothetical protein